MSIVAYAAKGPRGNLERFEYEPAPLGPHDIEISVTHCGICRSDLHLIDDDWGVTEYPLVAGHEIVGEVAEMGPEVRRLKKGQRVGVGWQCASCYECDQCLSGRDNLCPDQQATCVGRHGGFAEAVRVDSRFAFPIPDSIRSDKAAPLLCGGTTVYSPLRHYQIGPAMKVGVIGVGGLGHLALQFANAMGCEVTAFSSTAAKEDEASFFGADRFVHLQDERQLEAAAGTLDFLLSTVHVDLDWRCYLNMLRPGGTLCFVGASPGPLNLSPLTLITGAKAVAGSPIGSRAMIREMLEFAARNSIEARSELFAMADVNAAIARLRENRARYRIVLRN